MELTPWMMYWLLISIFLPSTKQMGAIFVVPAIVNNKRVQEYPEKVLDLGLEWLEELKPSSDNEQ